MERKWSERSLSERAHPYTNARVTIIGGNNSAVDAALELVRVGAELTIVYRGETYSPRIKPWVRPVFEGLVNKERIAMRFASRVVRIDSGTVTIEGANGTDTIGNDFVLALTGFRPAFSSAKTDSLLSTIRIRWRRTCPVCIWRAWSRHRPMTPTKSLSNPAAFTGKK